MPGVRRQDRQVQDIVGSTEIPESLIVLIPVYANSQRAACANILLGFSSLEHVEPVGDQVDSDTARHPSIFSQFPPVWFNEGLSEIYSDNATVR